MAIKDKNASEKALQVHLTEYESVRDEINLQMNLQTQIVNYAIAVIAGTVTIATLGVPPIASQFPVIFLIASLIMCALNWAFLEKSFQINTLGRYIHTELVPKIQALIGKDGDTEYLVLRWEEAKVRVSPRNAIAGILAMGKFAITFIPVIVFISVFYFTKSTISWTLLEKILFWFNIGALAIYPLGGIVNIPFIIRLGKSK